MPCIETAVYIMDISKYHYIIMRMRTAMHTEWHAGKYNEIFAYNGEQK